MLDAMGRQRLIALGYREAEWGFYKPDDRSSLKRQLALFSDTLTPTLHSLRVGISEFGLPPSSLATIFALELFACSARRRSSEKADGLPLAAARETVAFSWRLLESAAEREGVLIDGEANRAELLALEMAATFPHSPAVRTLVSDELWKERKRIFDDSCFTHNDPNITVHRLSSLELRDRTFFEDHDPEMRTITERVSATISRTLDYLEHIKHLPDYRRFFSLRRALTVMSRVGEVILGSDY